MSGFVFDGDDTLWMNEWQYSGAYAAFFNFLYNEALPGRVPNLHYVMRRFFEIDKELFKIWGVRRGRDAECMLQLYREICAWAMWRFDEDLWRHEHEEKIREISDRPFDFTKLRWVPGAEMVLETFKAGGHTLCFLSSYDFKTFPARAEFLGLSRYFDSSRIRLTEFRKTREDFVAVSGWKPENANSDTLWYAIGNGESDILPALEIADNWHGIYIPHGSTSAYFSEAVGPQRFMPPAFDHPRVRTIRSIQELLSIIK